ncbi:MAG: phosphocholine cytidylyltransferase family protein [Alphaproteobacteria bacterium]|nr:phosphocholine cytidylyltransferase family protein [Alphaproteobacteria bacterium]MBO4644094.1 phosphocholine cytidylyltransferase family protein [Alphaproteobacteria bacterium]
MKALILAAGSGTRMGKYTENLPKGMLNVNGRTLIERQIETLRAAGIGDIAVATGYKSEKIAYAGVKYYHNAEYATTNMLETIMCAKAFLNDDVLIAYSDIMYTPELAKKCVEAKADIGVAVDKDWKKLWKLRYDTVDFDLETLFVDENGNITDLGRETNSSEGLDYRYIGLIKFSKVGLKSAFDIYGTRKKENAPWPQSGKEFKKGYMTDLLSELIRSGMAVKAIVSAGGWAEFDTAQDYERLSEALKNGKLTQNLMVKE